MDMTMVELFAGVGGFRVGLNDIREIDSDGRAIEKGEWKCVWANQWEPATKAQHAYDCYVRRFGSDDTSNIDINLVDKRTIPSHSLLTAGFPCQDYSVAHGLKDEKGIEGKKGVLWWAINDILTIKKPPFVLLENVDRLLKSPSKQRGQAFGIILRCLADAGYGVQWRVINAADYGHPQKRRRVFIFAFHESTEYYKNFETQIRTDKASVITDNLMFSVGFPCEPKDTADVKMIAYGRDVYKNLADLSSTFAFSFENAGFCYANRAYTLSVNPLYNGPRMTLGDCLDSENIPDFCYKVDVEKFKYMKGAKRIFRTSQNGHQYYFSEGPIPFPDNLDTAGRTMLTSEGTMNRSTHFIEDPVTGRYRILSPIECERLDEFPDGWTDMGMPHKRRYFMMGNALVTGLIKTMGEEISKFIKDEVL